MTDALVQPRKYHRYRLEVPVIFSWTDAQGIRKKQVGLTRDISVGGAFVFATPPPPLDANIKLKGFVPSGGQVPSVRMFGKGQVVRMESAPSSLPAGFAIAGGRIVFRKWAEN